MIDPDDLDPAFKPSRDGHDGVEHPIENDIDHPANLDGDPSTLDAAMIAHMSSSPSEKLGIGFLVADRFRLEERLSRRGTALTWRATDLVLSRPVLVHILPSDDPHTKLVLHEATRSAIATDFRFLRVLDILDVPHTQCSFVVAEFTPGCTLGDLLQQKALSGIETAWLIKEISEAMGAMHSQGIFHLSLSPDSVVVTTSGAVKIVGLLIDAALAGIDTAMISWDQQQRIDMRLIGKLMYASMVDQWPAEPSFTKPQQWGMPVAPRTGTGWVSPREIKPGVSPILNQICSQLLGAATSADDFPIETCAELTQVLSRVLGTVDGTADLERRVMEVSAHPVPGRNLQISFGDAQRSDSPHPVPSPSITASLDVSPSQPHIVETPSPAATDQAGEMGDFSDDADRARSAITHRFRHVPRYRPSKNRRWFWMLILTALLCIGLAFGIGTYRNHRLGLDDNDEPVYLPISAAYSFDPEADGGNGEENDNLIPLAYDDDQSTGWLTLVYLNYANFGKLKPGVGYIVDLGKKTQVTAVHLLLAAANPSKVGLYIPLTDYSDSDMPPRDGISQWQEILPPASVGPQSVVLAPAQPTTTRYLMVYFTELPQVDKGRYQGGIRDIKIQR